MKLPLQESAIGRKDQRPVHEGHGAQTPDATANSNPAAYLFSVVAGFFACLFAFYGLLFLLLATGNLPPPAFSNSLCVDEKLNFLREQPVDSPNLLVIGSSVAWRHFDGASVAGNSRGMRPLNGGFCGLHANQSIYAAHWLLDRHPTVEQVVMIASPQDFTECSAKPTEIFDRKDADDFVHGGASRWPYYMRYFSPGSLLGNARRIKAKRANHIELDPLVFDRFGSGPMNTTSTRPTLYYGQPEALDPACFKALASMAARLKHEARKFIVVSTPLHPEWKAKEDPQGLFLEDFDNRIVQALQHTSARYWNANKEWMGPTEGFTDAIHLRWSAAQEFSAALARQLGPVRGSVLPRQDRPGIKLTSGTAQVAPTTVKIQ